VVRLLSLAAGAMELALMINTKVSAVADAPAKGTPTEAMTQIASQERLRLFSRAEWVSCGGDVFERFAMASKAPLVLRVEALGAGDVRAPEAQRVHLAHLGALASATLRLVAAGAGIKVHARISMSSSQAGINRPPQKTTETLLKLAFIHGLPRAMVHIKGTVKLMLNQTMAGDEIFAESALHKEDLELTYQCGSKKASLKLIGGVAILPPKAIPAKELKCLRQALKDSKIRIASEAVLDPFLGAPLVRATLELKSSALSTK
jgi:hypothetical protein